jgi:hypothetical protein
MSSQGWEVSGVGGAGGFSSGAAGAWARSKAAFKTTHGSMAASAAARGMSVFSLFNYRSEWWGGMIYSG